MKEAEFRFSNESGANNEVSIKGLTDEHFFQIACYLRKKYGLRVPLEKKTMLESRLLRRLRALNLSSFSAYIKYVFENGKNDEYIHFIDLVTTHKTSFFREDYQFEFLKKILPAYCQSQSGDHRINVWSAGCSTGEEVYTLGIVLNEFRKHLSSLDYKIVGTDISMPSLQKAASGVYSGYELQDLPNELREKYFKPNAGQSNGEMVFNDREVCSRIRLGVLNLNNTTYKLSDSFDFIFCRNVTIYFDVETQRKVLSKLTDKLKQGGYLFLGHSETAIGSVLPVKSIQPTIYQKLS
ncbi:protein-glutamate O-methyltransferase CheR [Cesiribacter sp. SM1]|uniref:CheR family methyltransferase n=1 Tax=Cesiribacter sp. SM1 TaxID=2861196 RepID=UPI001CD630EF|nr:CheR family methyltransferase [Cesiribacter sp. SM1]